MALDWTIVKWTVTLSMCASQVRAMKNRRVDIEKALFEGIRTTFGGDTFLFQTRGGKPLLPSYMSYEITKAARRVLGRRISAHSLRHSFATLTIRNGASVKAVSEYLGHSNAGLTL